MYKIIGLGLFLALFISAEAFSTLHMKTKTSENVSVDTAKDESYRLSESVVPNSYNIELTVRLSEHKDRKFTFDGKVIILLDVKKTTKNIKLHSQNLNINKIIMIMEYPVSNLPVEVDYTNEGGTNFLSITKLNSEKFEIGQYNLTIRYEGKLRDNLNGFYRTHYINDKGEKVWLATTHFEPCYARKAFPCFDEPAYKAIFDMKITHNKKFHAIFNTKRVDVTDNLDGTMTTKFEKTPLMSTYLLAFVVSDFKRVQNAAKNVSVYARSDMVQFGEFAVKKSEEILKKLEAFTGIPFETKIGKVYQIAVPGLDVEAMENWGLITYKENELLYNKENCTTLEKQHILEIITHEFVHQWFGNLVSPKWWQYTWLNEGFATFFHSYIVDQIENSWRFVEQAIVVDTHKIQLEDSEWSFPIENDCKVPEICFNSPVYKKAAAIIRMMQHYLTHEIFQKGLQQYLVDFKYKAADSDDLFNSIQKVVDKENRKIQVKTIMGAWINNNGYPIVTATRDYKKKSIILTQERFFSVGVSAEDRNGYLWHIPISYATEKNPDFQNTSAQILFNKTNDTVLIEDADKNHWIILNKQEIGLYRVNYDEDNWKLIINYLHSSNREKIHPLNRAQLINDAWAFFQKDLLSLQTLLQLTAYLKNETDYIAWYPAIEMFSYFKTKLVSTEYYIAFKEYVLDVTATLVKSVGLETVEKDDHIKKLNRIRTISLICSAGHPECLNNVHEKLLAWLNDEKKNTISKDLQDAVFCYGLQNANFTVWEKVFNKSKSHKNFIEKNAMIKGLSCSNYKSILNHYLNDSIANYANPEYILNVISNILNKSDVGVDAVLEFIAPNIFRLCLRLCPNLNLSDLLSWISRHITTKEQLEKLKAMEHLSVVTPHVIVTEAINLAEQNLEWLQKHNETLASEFIRRPSRTGTSYSVIQ